MKLDLNDPKLTAYALGELDAAERALFEAHVQASPEARQAVDEIRAVAALLGDELRKDSAAAASTDAALSQLDRIAIADETQPFVTRRARFPWIGAAVAASLLGAIAAYVVLHKKPDAQLTQSTGPQKSTNEQKQPKKRPATKPNDNKPGSNDPHSMPSDAEPVMPEPPTVAESTTPEPGDPASDTVANGGHSNRPNAKNLATLDNVSWIDERVAALWKENGIKPSAAASDGEFVRRAYLDIVGRVPPAKAAADYIKSKDKDKKKKLILELVNSDEYTNYWASIWSNLLVGRNPGRNIRKDALHKYLRDNFDANKPWNHLVYELVTAKGGSTTESVKAGVPFNGATNFLLAHMNDSRVPATAFTTRLFLGVQVQCTQCHDHPFNDRTQESFWGINAFFQNIRRQEHNVNDEQGRRRFLFAELRDADVREGADLFVRFEKRNGFMAVVPPRLLNGVRIDEAKPNMNLREVLAQYITDEKNDLFAQAIVNRMWGHFLGRGIVHPLDDMGEHNPASNPELLTKLADSFRESNYDLKRLITWITLSRPYSLSSKTNKENKDDDQYFSHFPLKQMSSEQFFDSLLVASQANKAGTKGDLAAVERMKDQLQRQFTTVFANDENAEADSFNGTIPQALLLMNGNIMAKAVSKEEGSFLYERVRAIERDAAKRGVKNLVAEYDALVSDLYLAAVSRQPTEKEKDTAHKLLDITWKQSKSKDWALDALQDIFWALLNSSEFVLNH